MVKAKSNQLSHRFAVGRQKFRSWLKRSVMNGKSNLLGENETLRDFSVDILKGQCSRTGKELFGAKASGHQDRGAGPWIYVEKI